MPPKKGTVKSKDKAEFHCDETTRHTGEFPLTKRDCPTKLPDGTKLYTFKFPCKPCAEEIYFEEFSTPDEDDHIREIIPLIDQATAHGDSAKRDKLLRMKARLEEEKRKRFESFKWIYKTRWDILLELRDKTGFPETCVEED